MPKFKKMRNEKSIEKLKKEISGPHGKIFFSWEFDEFPHQNWDKKWYWTAGIIVIALVVYSIFSKNFLFAIIVVMGILILIMMKRLSKKIKFNVAEDGIEVGKIFYEYKDIENFWLIYEPPQIKTLYFKLKGAFRPRLPIYLEDQNPVKIREILLRYLPEDLNKENEPASDQISRWLRL